MGLLSGQGAAPAATGAPATAGAVAKLTKEEKRARSKARREKKYNAAIVIRDVITAAKLSLTADQKAALDLLTRAPKVGGGGGFGESIFSKIFGATPTVGQSVTIQDVFQKTFKGVSQMNGLVRKWAAKGVAQIEYVHNAAEPFKSQYVIKALGTGNAAAAEK